MSKLRIHRAKQLGAGLGALLLLAASQVQAQQAVKSATLTVDPAAADLIAEAIPPPPVPSTPLARTIAARLKSITKLVADDPTTAPTDLDFAAANAFYTARGAQPIWVDTSGLGAGGKAAMEELQRAADWGLNPSDFPVKAVAALMSTNSATLTLDALAIAEIEITGAVMKYARHARGGRIMSPETQLSGYIDRRPNIIDPAKVLEQVTSAKPVDQVLREFHPSHRQFELLRQAYLAARQTSETNAIPSDQMVPTTGPVILPGKWHPDIAIVRRRLGVPKPPGSDAEWMEPELAAAIRDFQQSVGLKPDGMIGDRTRRAMNEVRSAASGVGVDRLLANMEAWRWMPDELGATRVEVNLPEQVFRFIRDEKLVHSERVIIGKTQTATPIFSDMMDQIVFQPTWGVPNSIKVNELLPQLQAGNGLRDGLKMKLGNKDIDPWDVDWSRADITKYTVFQPSGDDNALGEVKFLFPNSHAVYMHDTPNKSLFNGNTRLYSHGCVRVRNPMRFAEVLLDADRGMSPKEVRKLASNSPEDYKVRLNAKIPVHLVYFTASVDEAGKVTTAPDHYGHEKRIALALRGQFDKIKKLDPPVIEPGKPAPREEIARRSSSTRVATDVRVNGRLPPPAALGYNPPPAKPPIQQTEVWKLFQSSPQPSRGRSSGNSPSEMILRSLGGGF